MSVFLPGVELPARRIQAALLLFCVPTTHRFPESFAALHSQSLRSLAYSRSLLCSPIISLLIIFICALLPIPSASLYPDRGLWSGKKRQRIMAMAFTIEVDSSLYRDGKIRELDDGWVNIRR